MAHSHILQFLKGSHQPLQKPSSPLPAPLSLGLRVIQLAASVSSQESCWKAPESSLSSDSPASNSQYAPRLWLPFIISSWTLLQCSCECVSCSRTLHLLLTMQTVKTCCSSPLSCFNNCAEFVASVAYDAFRQWIRQSTHLTAHHHSILSFHLLQFTSGLLSLLREWLLASSTPWRWPAMSYAFLKLCVGRINSA